MKRTNFIKSSPVFLLLCVFTFNSPAAVSATTVTDIYNPVTMEGYEGILFGDFYTWSLPVLDKLADANFDTGDDTAGGDDIFNDTMVFRQATSPGQIKDDVVLYTFPAAAVDNSDTLGVNGDDAFKEDKQITGNFGTGLPRIAEPSPTGSWDTGNAYSTQAWDVSVDALNTWLGGDEPIFYFNNNQVGSELEANSLFGWGQVSLTNSTTGAEEFFYFMNPYSGLLWDGLSGDFGDGNYIGTSGLSGDRSTIVGQPDTDWWVSGGDPAPTTFTIIDPNTGFSSVDIYDDYGFIPGFVYVNTATGQLSLDPTTLPGYNPADPWEYVKLNLGANEAAYAAYSAELSAALVSGLYDAMHVDFRIGTPVYDPEYIGMLNNGYEQLIIRKSTVTNPDVIPEPATMLLLGTGLVGVAGAARRKKKNKA